VPQPNVEGFPLHDALSKVSPVNPVILEHASGHATYVNAKAMELAGITAVTKSPAGGDILTDRAGRPIGVLRETASDLAEDALAASIATRTPEERAADARKVIDAAVQAALEKGVTSFQDAGESDGARSRSARSGRAGHGAAAVCAAGAAAGGRLGPAAR
jgi:hypothetical protein